MKLYLCFITAFLQSVCPLDHCRLLKFGNVYPDSAFNKNIIKNFTVDSGDLCQIQCFLQYDCKSYNLGPPSEQGKRVCELSSSLHVFHANHLAFRSGFTYHPSTDFCKPQCPEEKICFVDGEGHSCFCSNPGFQGERCDEDVDECLQGRHDCHVSATCQNTFGSFTCICPSDKVSDGKACHGFPFHWTFNGSDRLLTLKGAARFTEQDGRTVLYLDGTPGTFAETPALPIQQTNLSITVWIKRSLSPTSRQMIYGDWSSPHQFRFDVMTDARLCVDVRRDSSVVTGLLNFCTPFSATVPVNEWSHVAFTWSRVQHTGSLYINGHHLKSKIANISVETKVDLKNSGHTVYDIGLKRDSGETTGAFLSDLMVFDRVLSNDEIKNELVVNHPLHSFT